MNGVSHTMSPFPEANGQIAPADAQADGPVTLHQVMQQMIADGLKERYEPPAKLSHELFVLMMQINENDRLRAAKAGRDAKGNGRAHADATA